jgi:phosphotransferase system enzyme I (PtsP)
MSTPRRLLARLRETMALGAATLPRLAEVVASELVSEVCSIYVMKPGDLLELAATTGLNPAAVGHTRLLVGEGIVGMAAATAKVFNLPDAQNHPAFAFRSETGEAPYASMLAVPVRRAGRTHGVLAVQNRAPRTFTEDEVEVVETVAMLLAEMLATSGNPDGAAEGLASTLPRRFAGTRLVAGIAVGPVVMVGGGSAPKRMLADDPDAELKRLGRAVKAMQRGLDELIESSIPPANAIAGQAMLASREVLEAYRLVAADAGWLRRVQDAVRNGLTAEAAVHRVAGDMRDGMRRIADPYLRERVADLEDLASRLLAVLGGDEPPVVEPGAILIARRLGPAELLDWQTRGIAGVAIEEASATSHAAIIARALGLPTLAGMRGMLEAFEPGDDAVLDADDGTLVLRPDSSTKDAYVRALQARNERTAGYASLRDRPPKTRDGTFVRLMLNVGLAMELEQLEPTRAAGIGLFRTEIAMLARGLILDVADQALIYRRVLDAAGSRPVLFRTLDLGGDKLLPGTPPPEEENPAMGWRSLRIGLDRPALLRRQLRALLLAAEGRKLSVMFPMVATVAEFRAARRLLLAEVERCHPPPETLSVGAMMEIPALLWQLPELLQDVDFISVGTNDLMQFLFAADRGSPGIAERYDLLSPPVLDLLEQLYLRADAAGVAMSVCGEAASRPLEALVLVALGYTTLSMPASAIMPVKALLAGVDLTSFRPVLAAIRKTAAGAPTMRDAISAWAREQGLPF